MRIALYNVTATYLAGGLETYCWEAGRALARRGHDVTIVAGNRGNARHDDVHLRQFSFRPEKSWPDLGVRVRRLAERLSFARHSIGHLVTSNYDAVIVNKPFDFPILWWARKRGMRAKTLFRSGGTDFFPGDRLFTGAIQFWVSASGYNAAQIAARYDRRVSVIHNGVDTDVFRPLGRDSEARRRMGIAEDTVVMVSVGRLVGWKGTRLGIEILPRLPAEVTFLIVGDGPERVPLQTLAMQLGVADRVKFAGAVAHDGLPQLLSNCDIFIQPSYGEEAFGISVVEAMACGLPVLASQNGGLPEIVEDEVTGRLLPVGDLDRWTDAMQALCASKRVRESWGREGRERAERLFTWAANAAALEATFSGGEA